MNSPQLQPTMDIIPQRNTWIYIQPRWRCTFHNCHPCIVKLSISHTVQASREAHELKAAGDIMRVNCKTTQLKIQHSTCGQHALANIKVSSSLTQNSTCGQHGLANMEVSSSLTQNLTCGQHALANMKTNRKTLNIKVVIYCISKISALI